MKISDTTTMIPKSRENLSFTEALEGFVCFKSFAASFLVVFSIDPGKGCWHLAEVPPHTGLPWWLRR